MFFVVLYDLVLLIYAILFLPKILFDFSKYKGTISKRLFFKKPKFRPDKKTIWIHAVSLGEMKAAALLSSRIKKEEDVFLIVSTATKTGFKEGEKNSLADHLMYLPLDFSWIMRKLIKFFQCIIWNVAFI